MAGAALFFRLLDRSDSLVSQGPYTSPDENIADVGAYGNVALSTRVFSPGTTGDTVVFEHAAVKEETAWVVLGSHSIATQPQAPFADAFENTLRFIRLRVPNPSPSMSLSIDLIARP